MNRLLVIGLLGLVAGAFCLGRVTSDRTVAVEGAAVADTGAKASVPDPVGKDGPIRGWKQGKGWGWIWGKEDEVGSLNAMNADTIKAALQLAKSGKVYDLGIPYDRNSFRWPGHSPGEIMSFRTPEGIKRQGDFAPAMDPRLNSTKTAWHSNALFINDNVATQLDGLGHITTGEDNHWYNGFKEADWGGNFGIRKCDSTTIPPIITRGILLDIAGARGVETLPGHFRITAEMLKDTMEKQKTEIRPGDSVFIRTGTLRHWGANGADHDKLRPLDAAGIDKGAARWLVEEKGAILIGSDTSGLEWTPGPKDTEEFIPVHRYLLIEQGVHIGEFHYLEDLAKDKAYEFCYVCTTNKIRGTVAGFCLRPLALR